MEVSPDHSLAPMEVYVRLLHKRQLVAVSLPKGSLCGVILERFCANENCYIHQNGYQKSPEDELQPGETVDVAARLPGGKGGFGSMLRAIGAQIEKTTNREACRDLTGRRLRAINDERRYRHYAKIKAQRKMEREEKRRRKLETLATSEPRHEFNDHEYISERTAIPERVEQALEDAFSEEREASGGTLKQKGSSSFHQPKKNQMKGWIDEPEGFEDFEEMEHNDKPYDEDESDAICKRRRLDSSQKSSDTSIDQSEDNNESVSIVTDKKDVAERCCREENNEDAFEQVSTSKPAKSNDLGKSGNSSEERGNSSEVTKSEEQTKSVFETNNAASSAAKVPLDWSNISSVDELISKFSADDLKAELSRLGVKCGGTLEERANRLWTVRNLRSEDIPKKLRAKK